MLGTMESEAIGSGTRKILIYGSSIINDGFFNPTVAARFGYSLEQSGNGAFMQKILTP